MARSWASWGMAAAAVVTALAAAPVARADVISEGTKWVATRVVLSAGRYADWCERSHLVKEGETIESIARAAYGDEQRAAEVRRCNELPADGQPKVGAKLVLPAKTAEPAGSAEPLAWEFWMVYFNERLNEASRFRPGDDIKGPHRGFTLLALPVAKSADFAKLRGEKPKAQIDGKWEAEVPWLVVSRDLWSGKVVGEESKAVKGVATCTFEEATPAPDGGKRWTFTQSFDYVDQDGKNVPSLLGGGFIDLGRAWPLVALSGFGALLLGVLRRRRTAPRLGWLAPVVAALLLAPAARADIVVPGTKSVESSARVVLAESATAKGAPAWELWRVGDGGPRTAQRIEAGAALRRDSSWDFHLLAVAAGHAADFEALRQEKAKESFDAKWASGREWLVVSEPIDLPKSVDDSSPVARIELTYELRAADPATNGKAWQIVAAGVAQFDGSGQALSEAQALLRGWGGKSLLPLGLVALVGALWAWRRARPGRRTTESRAA